MSFALARPRRGAIAGLHGLGLACALACSACGDAGDEPALIGSNNGGDASAEPATAGDAGAALASDASGGERDAAVSEPIVSAPIDEPDYEAAKKLIGSYAVRIKYRDIVAVGVAGTGSLVTTMFAAADIRDDPAAKGVKLEMSLCDSRSAAPEKHLADLVVTIPESALGPTRLGPVALRAGKSRDGMGWETDELSGVAGWKPGSAADELPSLSDDPRVVDDDDDGQPGVSAEFTGHANGSLYLALQYRFQFSGSMAADGALSGRTTSLSRESFLGSSEILLFGTVIERSPDPETGDNTVRFVRNTSSLSCEQLIAQKATLFP